MQVSFTTELLLQVRVGLDEHGPVVPVARAVLRALEQRVPVARVHLAPEGASPFRAAELGLDRGALHQDALGGAEDRLRPTAVVQPALVHAVVRVWTVQVTLDPGALVVRVVGVVDPAPGVHGVEPGDDVQHAAVQLLVDLDELAGGLGLHQLVPGHPGRVDLHQPAHPIVRATARLLGRRSILENVAGEVIRHLQRDLAAPAAQHVGDAAELQAVEVVEGRGRSDPGELVERRAGPVASLAASVLHMGPDLPRMRDPGSGSLLPAVLVAQDRVPLFIVVYLEGVGYRHAVDGLHSALLPLLFPVLGPSVHAPVPVVVGNGDQVVLD